MTIAFRYQNLPTTEKQTPHQFGHYYDLSKTMSSDDIQNADINYWTGKNAIEGMLKLILIIFPCSNTLSLGPHTFSNVAYHDLLQTIKNKIKDGKFFLKDKPDKRSVLRVALYSLGSPLWLPNKKNIHAINRNRDLDMFVFCLRALLRSAFAVALISIPTHLYDEVSDSNLALF